MGKPKRRKVNVTLLHVALENFNFSSLTNQKICSMFVSCLNVIKLGPL